MNRKLLKFLIAVSVVMVFASFATLAASITIDSIDELNITTGEVEVSFTATDMASTDQITVLVYTPDETNPVPVDTNIVYIDQNSNGTYSGKLNFKMKAGVGVGTKCTLLMGGTGVAEAASYEFIYKEFEVTITVNKTGSGIAEISTDEATGLISAVVPGNKKVKLNITPAIGYYISSVQENGVEKAGSFDAYKGSTYTYTALEDATFEVFFDKIESVSADVTASTGMTGVDALTLPEVFKGKVNNESTEDVSVAFGQISPNSGKTIEGYGIYLTYSDGSDVTTAASGIGPKFPAENKSSDNQFGIIFEQLKPGSYFAQTYIEYTDGSIVKGIKVPFTVAE